MGSPAKAEVDGRERGQMRGRGKRRVGRGEEERTPSWSIFRCPQGLDPLTILFSPTGLALSLCMEGAVRFHCDQLSFGQGQLRTEGMVQALVSAAPQL